MYYFRPDLRIFLYLDYIVMLKSENLPSPKKMKIVFLTDLIRIGSDVSWINSFKITFDRKLPKPIEFIMLMFSSYIVKLTFQLVKFGGMSVRC